MTTVLETIDLESLKDELRKWCDEYTEDFDKGILDEEPEGGDVLWGGLSEIDSKGVALTSPIFEKYLGIDLDMDLIKKGGYNSADELIDDLVPKMLVLLRQDQGE